MTLVPMTKGKDKAMLLELATRCEKAAGPDSETDIAIHTATSGFPPRNGGVGWPKGALIVPAFPGWQLLPAYTASLDAAMTLVPKGHCFSARKDFDGCIAFAWRDIPTGIRGEAATPALALCAASLRAKAAAQ